MNRYCFNREELITFLEKEFNLPLTTEEVSYIDTIREQWTNWEIQVDCTATLLSQILENKQKHNVDVQEILKNIYLLSETKGLFEIEQIDSRFIDAMFENVRDNTLEIEDNLIKIKQELNERGY